MIEVARWRRWSSSRTFACSYRDEHDHIGDLTEYAHLLAAKSRGKLKKFYCYLIGDTVNPLRLGGGWTQFPVGKGWFQSSELRDPDSRQQLGEMYSEILYFSDVVERAKKRIGVYQKKLNLTFAGRLTQAERGALADRMGRHTFAKANFTARFSAPKSGISGVFSSGTVGWVLPPEALVTDFTNEFALPKDRFVLLFCIRLKHKKRYSGL